MLKGEYVGLRSIEEKDLAQLLEWRNNPKYRCYFREHRELSMEDQLGWFENVVLPKKNAYMFAIIELKDGLLCLGFCFPLPRPLPRPLPNAFLTNFNPFFASFFGFLTTAFASLTTPFTIPLYPTPLGIFIYNMNINFVLCSSFLV